MNRTSYGRGLVSGLFGLLLIFSGLACQGLLGNADRIELGPRETRDDSFAVRPTADLRVSTFNGSITVTAGPPGTICVQATFRGVEHMSYEATERDGGVVVRATQTRSGDFRSRSPGAEFVITAPPGTSIDFDTSNGRVAVEGLEGSGRVHSSNGRITLEDVSGDFDVATSNGAVEASGFSGTLVASTSNGDISFSGALNAGSRNELRTSNGDITVRLPEGAGVAIDASTSRGQVRINRPIDASLTGDRFVIGVVGTGEADLVLRTSNGSVTIR